MLPAVAGFKFKEDENFNHRNTLSILRIALKVSAYASLRVTSCKMLSLTPENYAPHFTGQAQKLEKRGRFAKVSPFNRT